MEQLSSIQQTKFSVTNNPNLNNYMQNLQKLIVEKTKQLKFESGRNQYSTCSLQR